MSALKVPDTTDPDKDVAREANAIARRNLRVSRKAAWAAIASAVIAAVVAIPVVGTWWSDPPPAEERSEWTAEILDSRATVPRDDDRSCPWFGFDLDAVPTSGTWPIHRLTDPSEHIDLAWYFCHDIGIPGLEWVGTDFSAWGASAAGALPADADVSPEDCHAAALGDDFPAWRFEEYSGKQEAAYGTSLCLLSNLGRLARVTLTRCAVSVMGRIVEVDLRISVWTRTGGGPAPTAAPEPS